MKTHLFAASVSALLMLTFAGTTAGGDAYEDLATYDYDQPRSGPASIETNIRKASTPAERQEIERRLLPVLRNAKAPYAARQFVCRMLRRIGSEQSVPALAALLGDKDLSHMARFALQHMPCETAAQALRNAVNTVDGTLRVGIVCSLGTRRDHGAVSVLAPLINGQDKALARAAIMALGSVGSAEAAKALQTVTVGETLAAARDDALIKCADAFRVDGKTAEAMKLYDTFATVKNPMLRIAALRGMTLSDPTGAAKTIIAGLMAKDADIQAAARRFAVLLPGAEGTAALAAEMKGAAVELQIVLLDLLTTRQDAAAAPAVADLAASPHAAVRIAAVSALGSVGNRDSVKLLVERAAGEGDEGAAAVDSLNRIRGAGVGEAMSRLLAGGDAGIKNTILGVLVTRADKTTVAAILQAARDADPATRKTAVKGLAAIAGEEELTSIVALLLAAAEDEKAALGQALAAASARAPDAALAAVPLADAAAKADPASRGILLKVLARLGGPQALQACRAALESGDDAIVDAAVRSLSNWPDASPADDLLGIIAKSGNQTHRVLAFRGYVRMAALVPKSGQAMAMYRHALKLADGVDAKRTLLSGLSQATNPDALELVEVLADDPALRAETELAWVTLGNNLRDTAPDAARQVLKRIATTGKDEELREKARQTMADMDKYRGYITTWAYSGPYTKGDPYETVCPPEDVKAEGVTWTPLKSGVGPQMLDFGSAPFNGDNRSIYLRTYVHVPETTTVRLDIGSDDGNKVWVNDKPVNQNNATRPHVPGQDKAEAVLNAGWNKVLAKVAQGGGHWQFSLRIVKRDDALLEGLRVSLDRE